jgi:hypothetical protein
MAPQFAGRKQIALTRKEIGQKNIWNDKKNGKVVPVLN